MHRTQTISSLRTLRNFLRPLRLKISFLNLKFQFHPVIREPHMRRQRRIGLLMRQIVANMSEEGTPGFDPLHNAERIFHRRMRGMRLVPQRIEKQDVKVPQLIKRGFRHEL